ncbi:MAG: NfeD family protein [Cyanobacteria bacterium]|jgi:membrane protein implicated in regulation of membrane protease activity|nr:NfeD family protein [Cyanobacteriota bacterium]
MPALAPLIWLLLGLALLALEWLGAEFEGLLAAAVAALALSVATALLPQVAVAIQVLSFVGLTAVLLLALQRWSKRRRERAIPMAPSAELAAVISGFEGEGNGRVRWQGQSWAATNLEPDQSLRPGDTVVVMGRDGNKLQVLAEAASQ